MKNEKLFYETIDILVKAYMNDTLEHGNCSACAVGNIIASRLRYDCTTGVWRDVNGDVVKTYWNDVFCTAFEFQYKEPGLYHGEAKNQIDSTGYTWQELAMIEKAFEIHDVEYEDEDYDGYKGLMAVVEVLCKIHECEDVKEETKALFVK